MAAVLVIGTAVVTAVPGASAAGQPRAALAARRVPAITSPGPGLQILVGYADTWDHQSGVYFVPWSGWDMNNLYMDCGSVPTASGTAECDGQNSTSGYDGGAIAIVNNESTSLMLSSVVVDFPGEADFGTEESRDPWQIGGSNTVGIPAGATLVLTGKTNGGATFDTSDLNSTLCYSTDDGVDATISLTLNGNPEGPYKDSGQILNTEGVDPGASGSGCGLNEGRPFVPVGTNLSFTPTGAAIGADGYGGSSSSAPNLGCGCNSTAGAEPSTNEPVNTATGDYYSTVTDLSVPGSVPALQFTRTFDDDEANAENTANSGADTPPLGYGWSSNLGMTVAAGPLAGQETVTEENGAQVTFNDSLSSSWCAGLTTNFCADAPRFEATLNENSNPPSGNDAWTYTRYSPSGTTTFDFDSTGALYSVTTNAGTITRGTYASCASGDSCVSWTSSSGAELVLEFQPAGGDWPGGQLVSVFDPADSSLTATYAYTGAGCSSSQPDLCSVIDPSGTYTYAYANALTTSCDSGVVFPFGYELAQVTSPGSGGTLVNCYDYSNSSGEVLGAVGSQTDAAGEVTDFTYEEFTLDGGTAGTTTVTSYPDGAGGPSNVSQYTYSNGVLVQESIGVGTAGQETTTYVRDPESVGSAQTINPLGVSTFAGFQSSGQSGGTPISSNNVTSVIDGDNYTSQTAYTAANEVWCSVTPAAAADGVACPTAEPTTSPAAGTLPGTALCVASTTSFPCLGAEITYYNSKDYPVAVTDARGYTAITRYTDTGTSGEQPYCEVAAVEYSVDGVTCPAYGSTRLGASTTEYNAAGNVTSQTNPLGDTTTYQYGDSSFPSLPTLITAPDGSTTTDTYSQLGQLVAQLQSFDTYSAESVTAYDSLGRPYCQIAALAYSQGSTCPASPPTSPPAAGADPWPGDTITIYGQDNLPIYTVNPLGGVTETGYDEADQVWCSVSPSDYALGVSCPTTQPTTPPAGSAQGTALCVATTTSFPCLGATITYYDADGRVAEVSNPEDGVTLTTYDPAGNEQTKTVESSDSTAAPAVVTTYGYDADNRLTSTTVGASTSLEEYDPNRNVYCSVSANAEADGQYSQSDPGGYQCPAWQATWLMDPPSPSSLYSSTPSADQASDVTTSFYDADGDQLQTTGPEQQTTVSAYDGDGNAFCVVDPTNVASYLAANPDASYPYLCPPTPPSSPPTGTVTGYTTAIYDAAGELLSTTDQAGDTTSHAYGLDGQSLTTAVTGANSYDVTTLTNCYYDEKGTGQCAAAAPKNGGSGDMLYQSTTAPTAADPSGETTSYTYYPGGALDTSTSPAGTTQDGYNIMGELALKVYSGTANGYSKPANVSYSYYQDGSRETMIDGTGTTTYSDPTLLPTATGDETSQTFAPAADSGLSTTTVTQSYYSNGALESVVYPSYATSSASYNDPTASYTYNASGQMSSVSDWLGNETTFNYDADGNLCLQAVTTSAPASCAPATQPLNSTEFGYDAGDEPTGAVSAVDCGTSADTLTQQFSGTAGSYSGSLNADGQLTQYEAGFSASCLGLSSVERNYSYDAAGRVVFQGANPQGYSADVYSYDPQGDLTEISEHANSGGAFDKYAQSFDSAGELTAQSPEPGSGGSSTSYGYDTIGDQSTATSGTTTTTTSYDSLGEETSISSAPLTGTSFASTGDGLEADVSGWSPKVDIDSSNALYAISCPTSSFCAAGDNAGNLLTYDGQSWTSAPKDGANTIEGVSCASASFCVAVDNVGNASVYNGSSWSTPAPIDTSQLGSVSCPTSGFCAAVDNAGNVLTTSNGTSWTVVSPKVDSKDLTRISCASASVCAAVDSDGHVVTTTNGWSTNSGPTLIDGTGTTRLDSVSCPTTSFCMAVDNAGNAVSGDPTTDAWGTATDIDGTALIESVACTGSSFCVAVDSPGNEITFNPTVYSGDGWSSAMKVDTTTLRGPSCVSAGDCIAVDNKGNAIGFDGAGVNQLTWDSAASSLPEIIGDSANDYIYGPTGEPVEQVSVAYTQPTNSVIYLTYTPSDSSWLATTASGAAVSFVRYDAYGTEAAGTPVTPFGFAGQYASTPTVYAMRARNYSASSGQFLTRDPAFSSTNQAYAYAGGDPVNSSDPSGECWPSWACGFEHAIGSAINTAGTWDNYVIQSSLLVRAVDQVSRLTGLTLGGCAGGSYFGGVGVTGSLCYVVTPSGQSGFTFSLGGGGGGPLGLNALLGPLVSNTQCLNDLGGPFAYAEGSAGEGIYGAGDQFSLGLNVRGRTIWTDWLGWAPGVRSPVPIPFTFGGGATYTWTFGRLG